MRADLGARHPERAVLFRNDSIRFDGLREARPTGSRLELVRGAEEGLPGRDVDIEARAVVVPKAVAKRGLGCRALSYLVFERRKLGLKDAIAGLRVSALGDTFGIAKILIRFLGRHDDLGMRIRYRLGRPLLTCAPCQRRYTQDEA